MERFDDLVTDKRLRRSELEAFLDAADAGDLYRDEYRLFSTSGASGVSGLFVYSRRESPTGSRCSCAGSCASASPVRPGSQGSPPQARCTSRAR